MADLLPITDYAGYLRANDRISELMNNCATDAESRELDALVDAQRAYYEPLSRLNRVRTDGVDEVIAVLDYDKLTLDDALDAFGGLERFVEYMTRRGGLDAATLKVLVGEFGLDRAELEKVHCEAAGWDAISAEGQEACGDVECCPAEEEDWRVELGELTGIGRIWERRWGRGVDVTVLAVCPGYPARRWEWVVLGLRE